MLVTCFSITFSVLITCTVDRITGINMKCYRIVSILLEYFDRPSVQADNEHMGNNNVLVLSRWPVLEMHVLMLVPQLLAFHQSDASKLPKAKGVTQME